MKRLLFFAAAVLLLTACDNVKTIGPDEREKVICKEVSDTVLAHIPGAVKSREDYSDVRYFSQTIGGKQYEYHRYELTALVLVPGGRLCIHAEPVETEFIDGKDVAVWKAVVTDDYITGSEGEPDVEQARKHNLLMKRLFADDNLFTLEEHGKILWARFLKRKPVKPERPRSDYGL